ncbi:MULTISPECIES: TRAP transporter small permease [Neptunomonas]|uniref:TRAP transporter small permease protein n=1 Tax=Neptunomonas qingdaonensis TaxID=1045558 RepID=A0A1I2QZB7_9GAMM|nr:TRAP transporter small permease [Neptunomonas qingdaonensis]SFG33083.1 TRAP-type C4-dicarboxylate transport system, small permease component [Neptunomonas qingdaonensis]
MGFSAWLTAHYDEKGPVQWLAFALELVAALTLFFLMMLTCADVFGRFFFDNSVDGATELTEIGIAILVFAEMPIVTWRGGHVVVDILDTFWSNTVVKALTLLSALLMSGSLYYVGVRIFEFADRSLRRGEVTDLLEIPVGLIVQYIAFMSWATAALMMTYGIYHILTQDRD